MVEKSGKSFFVFMFGEEIGMIEFYFGFVCLVGWLNIGKFMLINVLVGVKVVIMLMCLQIIRYVICGIVYSDDFQIIFVDIFGLYWLCILLGKWFNDLVCEIYVVVDVIGLCIFVDEEIGLGDWWIVEQFCLIGFVNMILVVIVIKIDKVLKEKVVVQLVVVSEFVMNVVEIVLVLVMIGDWVDLLIDVLVVVLLVGFVYYFDGELIDEFEEVLMVEFICEVVFQGVCDELFYLLVVVIDEVSLCEGCDDLIDVYVVLYVE